MTAYLNDRFIDNSELTLHVSDLSMQRGYAIFDFLRTIKNVPLFFDDHLDRFYHSAKAMHLPVQQNREQLTSIIHQLIEQNDLPEAGIRIMLTGGYSADSYNPAQPNLIITCNPVKTSTKEDFEKGYSIITYEHQRELPYIKSISYLTAVWLQPLLREKKVNDVLYYNRQSITEFPRCNVFVVTNDGKLVTPVHHMLKGITRKQVLELAAAFMPVEERDITVDELMSAAEVFLTATTKKIIPVLKINDTIISSGKPGPVTTKLYEQFLALEQSLIS
ncbi:MAG: amino acid aminotransferase [Sphingobacteriales bacterium]|nr:MAG: amino acid aminotransferase [Sphingobacteriales bacterium]